MAEEREEPEKYVTLPRLSWPEMTPGRRKAIYDLALAIGPLLTGYGAIESGRWELWIAFAGAVLVPGLARRHVAEPTEHDALVEAFREAVRAGGRPTVMNYFNPVPDGGVHVVGLEPSEQFVAPEMNLDPPPDGLVERMQERARAEALLYMGVDPDAATRERIVKDLADRALPADVEQRDRYGVELLADGGTPLGDEALRTVKQEQPGIWAESGESVERVAAEVGEGVWVDAYGASEGPVESGVQPEGLAPEPE